MGRSLFADDGSLWKRGRNIAKYIAKKMQEGIVMYCDRLDSNARLGDRDDNE